VNAHVDDQGGEDRSTCLQGEGLLKPGSEPRDAYDRYAPSYDAANAENDYELWLGEVLLPELERRGLRKGWALDVGCGTGRAFEPLLDRGWQVVGCDVSPEMLAEAERKFGSRVRLSVMDARNLTPISLGTGSPSERGFQLVLLLNDVVNYMTEAGELEQVFAGVKRNLSETNGLVVFDANTLNLFREDFMLGVLDTNADGSEWHGLTTDPGPAGIYEARLSGRKIQAHLHRQRHWSPGQVRQTLEASGLDCVAALGQREEDGNVVLSENPSEERDRKVVYIATHVAQIADRSIVTGG
jgi:SAM-dependent methyltransferase